MYLLKGTQAEWLRTADTNALIAGGVIILVFVLCFAVGFFMMKRDLKELENEQAT